MACSTRQSFDRPIPHSGSARPAAKRSSHPPECIPKRILGNAYFRVVSCTTTKLASEQTDKTWPHNYLQLGSAHLGSRSHPRVGRYFCKPLGWLDCTRLLMHKPSKSPIPKLEALGILVRVLGQFFSCIVKVSRQESIYPVDSSVRNQEPPPGRAIPSSLFVGPPNNGFKVWPGSRKVAYYYQTPCLFSVVLNSFAVVTGASYTYTNIALSVEWSQCP